MRRIRVACLSGLVGGLVLGTAACGGAVSPTIPRESGRAAGRSQEPRTEGARPGHPRAASISEGPGAPPGTASPAASDDPAPSAARVEPTPIPKNTAVLHIGDSFVLAGFSQALKPRMKSLGVRYEVRSDQSSFTVTWAGKMERLVADTQPDLVIITLGANEVANTNPPSHAPAVRRIVKAIGARPCVWVSPPLWRKDTGIKEVIRENSAPCRFFDSDALVTRPIPRQSDKIHPNAEGGAVWADAFWAWLEAERVASVGTGASPWALRPAGESEHRPRALLAQGDEDP